jgi:phosphoribosylanthranilate isomerase
MVWIKICGLRTEDDARMASAAGADAVGAVVGARSPRAIGPDSARAVLQAAGDAQKVLVTAVDGVESLLEIAEAVRPDCIQLHGKSWIPEEMVGLSKELRAHGLEPVGLMRSVGISDGVHRGPLLVSCRAYALSVKALVLDSSVEGSEGGTGRTHDWAVSSWIRDSLPSVRVILAGGLNAGNVGEAISAVRPHGVDVSSGVESGPGRKDPALVRAFIDAARRES